MGPSRIQREAEGVEYIELLLDSVIFLGQEKIVTLIDSQNKRQVNKNQTLTLNQNR